MKLSQKFSLQTKMVASIVVLILFQLGATGILSTYLISTNLEAQLGKRALDISYTIARMPQLAELMKQNDPDGKIQLLVEKIRQETGAQFIVVGDEQGRRYSHPDPEKIGDYMVGGDNSPALKDGKAYISKAVGSMGASLRGKVPVIDARGAIVGIVSVGFLEESIKEKMSDHKAIIFIFIAILLVIGVAIAMFLAASFKRSIFGLEPDEIGRLYKERNAILASIREGIIAINADGRITMINQAATKALGLKSGELFLNKYIDDVLPENVMMDVLKTGESQLDCEHRIGAKEFIVNRIPIWKNNVVSGVVSSFREKDEIDILARELSQVQEYSDMLRAQTHEYSNKLYTISGLIQLEAYDAAIQLIGSETSGYQDLLHFLMKAVSNPVIAGCLLGKYNRAKELNIILNVDRESNFTDVPDWIGSEKIVTILGNLLDNAFEALVGLPENKRIVNLSFTDLGNDLIIEIEDSGKGVPDEINQEIYKKYFSTSGKKGRGIGLSLVNDALSNVNGHITLGKSILGGALFTVYISKEQAQYG